MTDTLPPPIWHAPGINDDYQCWSVYLDGGCGPGITLDVEHSPSQDLAEPYRFEARMLEEGLTAGGRSDLVEAQRLVRGGVIAYLETLLEQARALVPSGDPPQAESQPDPEVETKLLERLGVDVVFVTEAAVVFEGLAREYPEQNGPIEIIAAMLSERNSLEAFKARVAAGVRNP